MPEITFEVAFSGRARVTVDTSDRRFRHYFDTEGTGGARKLAEDLFSDDFDLDGAEHIEPGSVQLDAVTLTGGGKS